MNHNFDRMMCPKRCGGRLYVQAAETTCDYQCNICATEFNVELVERK